MPVVPQVDIDGARAARDEQQEVDTQADGDDEGTDSRIVGHSGCCGPSHVEDLELEVIELGNLRQRTTEIGSQQSGNDAQAHETDAHIEARLEGTTEFEANAKANDSKQDGHHDRCTQSDDVTKDLFHLFLNIDISCSF